MGHVAVLAKMNPLEMSYIDLIKKGEYKKMYMKVKVGGTWRETVYEKGDGQPSYSELEGSKEPQASAHICGGCTSYCLGNCIKGCSFNCGDGCSSANSYASCVGCSGTCSKLCSGCTDECGGGCGGSCDNFCYGVCTGNCEFKCEGDCDSCKFSCDATCGSNGCSGHCGRNNTGATLPTKVKIGNTWIDGCGIYYKEYNTWHDISNLD